METRPLILLAALLIAAAPSAHAADTYRSKTYEFKVPTECDTPKSNSPSPTLKCSGFTISVLQLNLNGPTTPAQFLRANGSSALKVVDDGEKTIANWDVAYVDTISGATSSTRSVRYAFLAGEAGYILSYTTPVKKFNQRHVRAIENIIRSFKTL